MNQSKPYRNCVGLVVINKDGHVFIGKRIDSSLNAWQMPQGGIEASENPKEAGLREMEEEIGTRNVQLVGEMGTWLNYDIPQKLSQRLWNGKYRNRILRYQCHGSRHLYKSISRRNNMVQRLIEYSHC